MRPAVQLGDDDGADVHGGLERPRLILRRLPDARVHDEDGHVWLHRLRHLPHLLEQRVLLLVTPRRVHDDQVVLLRLEALHAVSRDLRRIRLGVRAVKRDARLGGVLFQLIKGSGATRRERSESPKVRFVVCVLHSPALRQI